jgi:hypothetical protein
MMMNPMKSTIDVLEARFGGPFVSAPKIGFGDLSLLILNSGSRVDWLAV